MLQINELIFKWPNSIKMEVNLEASAGKIVLINGPSGIGKTTLFNIISGFYEPVSGSVTFEGKNLVSLRGTLVPATTINKAIGQIPILGDILVGKKTGEGVFGVSFKLKGPPTKLKTTVNPIKTLTPRFITRTLEKLKKN